jgi:DNA-binding transcriptional MerR regulator
LFKIITFITGKFKYLSGKEYDMKRKGTYFIKEFATLAGVTVRTLQFYDRAGLLKPSYLTEAGHRLYRPGDMLRLQQILTLKFLGFSLRDIGNILNSPSYNLYKSMQVQKQAIDQQITRLQQVSNALEQTLETMSKSGEDEIDWDVITNITRSINVESGWEWVRDYYTAEQLAWLQEAHKNTSREEIERGQQLWAEVIAGFAARAQLPPEDPEVQELAARMVSLVEGFTRGNKEIENNLRRMYSNIENLPQRQRPFSPELHAYMMRAVDIYQQRRKK